MPAAVATTYAIRVYTGNVPKAGTDSNVYITLYSEDGRNSGERLLDNSEDNFEQNKTDMFQIEMQDIGQIKAVRIRHDDSGAFSGWYLDKIVIHNNAQPGNEWTFPCNNWLAVDEGDHQIDRVLTRA